VFALIIALVIVFGFSIKSHATTYTFTTLSHSDGVMTSATGINNLGQ